MQKKPDWIKIRTEYETVKTSYRKLAEKYDIPFPTIRDRAKREEWTKGKEITSQKIVAVTSQKVVTKIAKKKADEICTEFEAAELISQLVLKTLQDPVQFNRHLIQRKEKNFNPEKMLSEESQWVEEQQFEVVDTKRLKDLASALQTSTGLKRLIKGILSAAEEQHLDLEREKLALEKGKANLPGDDEDDETGVVMMPPILDVPEEGEADEISGENTNSKV